MQRKRVRNNSEMADCPSGGIEKRKEQLFRELIDLSETTIAEGAQNLVKRCYQGHCSK